MARRVGPVRPRRKDERLYDRDLRAAVLDPLFRDLRGGLAEVSSLRQVWYAMDASVEAAAVRGVPIALIRKNLERIDTYHRARIVKAFRSALGIDIGRLLTDPQIQTWMNVKIQSNVDLIRTIPRRMHASLAGRLQKEFAGAPFDRQRVTGLLRREYKSSGYRLRRIARDQTTKSIGQLTEIRQRQLQIEGYEWSTSNDEDVRETHRANEGRFFRWDTPPAVTGHPGQDIDCRCVARPAVTKAARERLQAAAPA